MKRRKWLLSIAAVWTLLLSCSAESIVTEKGEKDNHTTPSNELSGFEIRPGNRIVLESGRVYHGTLVIQGLRAKDHPLVITSSGKEPAIIDAAGYGEGIFIHNSTGVVVDNLVIEADGNGGQERENAKAVRQKMRAGIFIKADEPGSYGDITIRKVQFRNIFYENQGFIRPAGEVHTANGTQAYGYGIRVISSAEDCSISRLEISGVDITKVSHTGIKVSAKKYNIKDIELKDSRIYHTGGPGIQMSCVQDVHIHHNRIDHTGSTGDKRNWMRGSGFWCWGADRILFEHNSMTYANGPADSAGAHIDFNCTNIVYQYNYSAYNAGGFVEILGNNRNCSYRYNISVEDGQRKIKGQPMARTLWISGYVGKSKGPDGKEHMNPPVGPFNCYIYNNTIYTSEKLPSMMSFVSTLRGALIANNIFYIKSYIHPVVGTEKEPKKASELGLVFDNNLCISEQLLPATLGAIHTFTGDPAFKQVGGNYPECYVPSNKEIVTIGRKIHRLDGDEIGLVYGLEVNKDFFGTPITVPIVGAVMPK